jgi:CRISPR system Cascade subunit CasA
MKINQLLWRDSVALFAFDKDIDHRPKAFRQAMAMHRIVPLSSRYQCMAIAIANKDANPLAWRREDLPAPFSLLEKPDTVQVLTVGMQKAEDAKQILDGAVKTFIRNVLPENSKDVNDKADATGTVQLFWDQLEGFFHTFLSDIDEGETALKTWITDIAATARIALESCVRQRYADSANSMKAWVLAADELNKRLSKLTIKQGGEAGE